MIFVTVGNANQGFRRLLDAIDDLAASDIFKHDSVLVQCGSNSDFHPRNCAKQDFFPPEKYRELIETAEIIVCHGGAGTLHHVFQAGKVPVVMPRRQKYAEHVDDQYALVKALAEQGRVIPAFEPADLPGAVCEARGLAPRPAPKPPNAALRMLENTIDEMCKEANVS
jgi:UDP-N-acetylglucosamine transferase subunit ALG13